MYIMGQEEVEAVRRVIESGQTFRYRGGEGGETDAFENELAEKIGVSHVIAVTSGTAALICGLVGLKVGPGDEVIVPAYTFMATATAVLAVGAVPVIAEIDESLTLDPEDAERKITPRTKVIIPVDMRGLPCNMDALTAIAKRHGLAVLEDACQAVGGSYKGRRLGSIGDAGAFSLNHFKNISCGEGGAVVTSDEEVYERALIYHDAGCCFRSHAAELKTPLFSSVNYRMNEILSAILRVQLGRLEGILAGLRAEKRRLMDELANETAFTFNPIHDVEGDCGCVLAIMFDSPEKTRLFIEGLGEKNVAASTPIDSGMHVYTNWEPIMGRRGAHHPRLDAFKLTDAPPTYSADMCPKTLSILERTAKLWLLPNRPQEELSRVIASVKSVAAAL